MRYVVVALLIVAALSGAAVAQEAPTIDDATTTFDVELQADGSAEWIVQTSIPVDSEDERDGFRTYGDRFVDGEAAAGPGVEFFERAAATVSTEAGREMVIERVERDYSVADDAGTLRLAFRWTNFLESDGDGYELADALVTDDGTWLRSLESGQELRIHTPPGYEIQRSIEARQENDSLVLTGPESFDPEEFSVVYQPEDSSGSATPGGTDEGAGPIVAGLIGLLVIAVGVLAVWRWRGGESIEPIVEEPDGGGTGAAAAEPTEPEPEAAPEVDPELLSDEERVEALLERNGGRMRQAAIVEETDWSDAKVSQLLSRMADEGKIEKLRLGRENVISFPEDEETDES